MIAELLTCALSLQTAGWNGHSKIEAVRMLVVNSSPERIHILRKQGYKAFGAMTIDWPHPTTYHAVCDALRLSFLFNSFWLVEYRHPNPLNRPSYGELTEVIPLIREGGFLAFSEQNYEEWLPLLRLWRWKKQPEPWGWDRLSVYQKPFRTSA